MTDVILAAIGGQIFSKSIDTALDKSFGLIVSKAINLRVRRFIEGLYWRDDGDLQIALDEMAKRTFDEDDHERIYCAYRSVCLAKSKRLAPMIIGLIASESIAIGDCALSDYDDILELLQNFYDEDVVEFDKFISKISSNEKSYKPCKISKFDRTIQWSKEVVNISDSNNYSLDMSPMDLNECIGRWASIAQNCRLVRVEVKENVYSYDDDSHFIDEPGTNKEVITNLIFRESLFDLIRFIELCKNTSAWK